MIYLASPYSHPDSLIRERRHQAVCHAAARLIRNGQVVFSPVAHSHAIALCGVRSDWEFWERQDRLFLQACDELVVLMLTGWRESTGVQAEIQIAEELGKPVRYLDPSGTTATTLADVAEGEER